MPKRSSGLLSVKCFVATIGAIWLTVLIWGFTNVRMDESDTLELHNRQQELELQVKQLKLSLTRRDEEIALLVRSKTKRQADALAEAAAVAAVENEALNMKRRNRKWRLTCYRLDP